MWPLKIRGKLGTHASDLFAVKGCSDNGTPFDLAEYPATGDLVFVQSDRDQRCHKYTQAIVSEIKHIDGQFFFMELA